MSRSFTCNGNVKPARFVKQVTTKPYWVVQSTDGAGSAGDASVGISQEGTHLPPYSPLDDTYAGILNDEILVYTEGDECMMEIGLAVVAGDMLKSDSVGRGIPGVVSGDQVGARALATSTVVGSIIKVKVMEGRNVV